MRVRLTVSLERGRRCRAPFFSVWTVSRMCTRYAHVQCTRTSQLSPFHLAATASATACVVSSTSDINETRQNLSSLVLLARSAFSVLLLIYDRYYSGVAGECVFRSSSTFMSTFQASMFRSIERRSAPPRSPRGTATVYTLQTAMPMRVAPRRSRYVTQIV